MAGITLAYAETQLQLWLDADTAVAAGQSFSFGNRSLTRVDAAEITRKIDYWNVKVQELSARAQGYSRTRYVVPR